MLYSVFSYIYIHDNWLYKREKKAEITKTTFLRLKLNLFISLSLVLSSFILLHLNSALFQLQSKVYNKQRTWYRPFFLLCYMITVAHFQYSFIATIFLLYFSFAWFFSIPSASLSTYLVLSWSICCVVSWVLLILWNVFFKPCCFTLINRWTYR